MCINLVLQHNIHNGKSRFIKCFAIFARKSFLRKISILDTKALNWTSNQLLLCPISKKIDHQSVAGSERYLFSFTAVYSPKTIYISVMNVFRTLWQSLKPMET